MRATGGDGQEGGSEKDRLIKIAAVVIPIAIAILSWAYNLSLEVQDIKIKQIERGPIITELKADVALLLKAVTDPSPKPETKIAVDALRRNFVSLEDRLGRMDDRLNNLHSYILALPIRPAPFNGNTQKRHGFFDAPSELPIVKSN
jgi:hypothetical protein